MPEQNCGVSAEGHAQAEFAFALRGGIGDDAVESDGGEEQGQAAENGEQADSSFLRRSGAFELRLHADEGVMGEARIERVHLAREERSHNLR